MPISARLVVNQAALKTRRAELQPLIDAFCEGGAQMKLRRLSTRAAGFDAKLAALTRYEAAQDAQRVSAWCARSLPPCASAATPRCSPIARRFDRVKAAFGREAGNTAREAASRR